MFEDILSHDEIQRLRDYLHNGGAVMPKEDFVRLLASHELLRLQAQQARQAREIAGQEKNIALAEANRWREAYDAKASELRAFSDSLLGTGDGHF